MRTFWAPWRLGRRLHGSSPKTQSARNLRLNAQHRFFLNAACVDPEPDMSIETMWRGFNSLARMSFRPDFGSMVMAFDRTHDVRASRSREQLGFLCAQRLCARHCADQSKRAYHLGRLDPSVSRRRGGGARRSVAHGAWGREVAAAGNGYRPCLALCDRSIRAMAKFDLPLITHGGQEKAVEGAHRPDYGNALQLRRPLERGVRVVVAHCASLGRDVDLDKGADGPNVESVSSCSSDSWPRANLRRTTVWRYFRSSAEQSIRVSSAYPCAPRVGWRLLNGSDYPLPA